MRFWPDEEYGGSDIFRPEEHPAFQLRQVGPTGTITAQGWVRALPCSPTEYLRRCKLGEPPPTPWKRRLYLEWYGQNGRVAVEMAGPLVDERVREPEGEDDEGGWEELMNLALPPDLDAGERDKEPRITVVDRHELDDDLEAEMSAAYEEGARILEENPIYDCELIDECIENNEGEPIASFVPGAEALPPADSLDDEEVEAALKGLLGRLAMLGVALDVCEHFTPRDCYRLLCDEILPQTTIYEELIGTGWVQHVCTYEYCAKCEAELEMETGDTNDPADN